MKAAREAGVMGIGGGEIKDSPGGYAELFRCKGSRTRTRRSQRFTGQLQMSRFVAISMRV